MSPHGDKYKKKPLAISEGFKSPCSINLGRLASQLLVTDSKITLISTT